MTRRSADFESAASASSAIPALGSNKLQKRNLLAARYDWGSALHSLARVWCQLLRSAHLQYRTAAVRCANIR